MDAATTPSATALRYRVGGMDCPSCAGKIEMALNRLGGAEKIRLDYQTQILTLHLDERATPREALEAKVRRLGFDIRLAEPFQIIPSAPASEHAGAAGTEPAWWSRTKPRLLLAIGVL